MITNFFNKIAKLLQNNKGEENMETQQLITFRAVQKKPVQVEACRLSQGIWCQIFNAEKGVVRIGQYTLGALTSNGEQYFLIETLEDVDSNMHRAEINDWLIKGVQNELYACKPDIFTETYNLLSEEDVKFINKLIELDTLCEATGLILPESQPEQSQPKTNKYTINGVDVAL